MTYTGMGWSYDENNWIPVEDCPGGCAKDEICAGKFECKGNHVLMILGLIAGAILLSYYGVKKFCCKPDEEPFDKF